MDIKGHVVRRVWVEHASDIAEEYYASFTLDRSAKLHLLMLSAKGGVDIEEVAATDPDAIVKLHVDPVDGLSSEAARAAAAAAGINPAAHDGVAEILVLLYRCYTEGDCDLAEINPLILKPTGEVHALDAKVSLDGSAEFRHPEWEEFKATEELDERERLAREKDLQYIGLDGSVGIIANGAGLAMSTLDVVNQVGGRAANFLDIGGGANADVMAAALEVINFDESVRSILINIFGGITRGEEVAKGIVEAVRRVELRAPMVIRLDGTNAEEGRRILIDAGIPEDQLDLEADHARRRGGRVELRPHRLRSRTDGHLRRPGDQGHRPGSHRRAGPLPRPAQPGLRNTGGGRGDPRQGRPGRRGHPRSSTPMAEAVAATGAGASFVAVPPRAAPAAILEAAAAGIGFVVCITEGVPAQDEARTFNLLKRNHPESRLLGPNCPGIISPGKCNIGITAGDIAPLPRAEGPNVGIVCRSGTLTYQALYELKQNGIGVSTCVGIGGDPVPGTSFVDCLAEFEKDPETHAIILIGEIGGSAEEEAAEFITATVTKPMSAYIAGVTAPAGQEDGPCRRHRLGRQGHGPGQDGRAGRGRRAGRAQPDRGRRADGRDRRPVSRRSSTGAAGAAAERRRTTPDERTPGMDTRFVPLPSISMNDPTAMARAPSSMTRPPSLSAPASLVHHEVAEHDARGDRGPGEADLAPAEREHWFG